MYSLTKINGYALPEQLKGNFAIKLNDDYNEYKSESGKLAIESIREGRIEATVKYGGLVPSVLKAIKTAITLVSSVEMYDPTTQTKKTFNALVTGLQTAKTSYKNSVDVWSLSFRISQL